MAPKKKAAQPHSTRAREPFSWEPKFLEVLEHKGNVSEACRAAKVARRTVYEAKERHEDFAASWQESLAVAVDAIEAEAHRRAVAGIDKPIFFQGDQCATVKEYSDTLMLSLLKAHLPDKYRERRDVTVGNPDGTPLKVAIYLPEIDGDE